MLGEIVPYSLLSHLYLTILVHSHYIEHFVFDEINSHHLKKGTNHLGVCTVRLLNSTCLPMCRIDQFQPQCFSFLIPIMKGFHNILIANLIIIKLSKLECFKSNDKIFRKTYQNKRHCLHNIEPQKVKK